jgi:hypothetical protein
LPVVVSLYYSNLLNSSSNSSQAPSATSTGTKELSKATNTGSIVGGVVGGVVGFLLLMLVIAFFLIRRRHQMHFKVSQVPYEPAPNTETGEVTTVQAYTSPSITITEKSGNKFEKSSRAPPEVQDSESQLRERIANLEYGAQEPLVTYESTTAPTRSESSRGLEARDPRFEDAVVEVLARLGVVKSDETPPSYS